MCSLNLRAADRCIYCGVESSHLSTEHVIPHSLAGRIKLPRASCSNCQTIINNEIEEPFVTKIVAIHRAKFGIKSRSIAKPKFLPIEVELSDGHAKKIHLAETDVPKSYLIPFFIPPPFLKLKPNTQTPVTVKLPGQSESAKLLDIVKRKYCPNANTVRVEYPFNVEQFLRLLSKISVGLFFDASPQSAIAAQVGQSVLNNPDRITDAEKLYYEGFYSMPYVKRSNEEPISFAIAFEQCENGKRWLYTEINLLTNMYGTTYYMRIPSKITGPLIRVEYIKSRKQTFTDLVCDIA
ncbi:HNH endonuclease [Roseovarius sp. EL26]|uniref:HNH endonuclease n=1 Tax=Roseovarius sp. EL26 TaxID=2126672 RepID=UPI000EA17C1D|nr:HNH endonuclease [Roseovarius sp. EL26]